MPFGSRSCTTNRRQVVEVCIYSDAIFQRVDDDTQFIAQVRSAIGGGDTNDSHSLSTDEKAHARLRAYLDKYYAKARHLLVAYIKTDGEQSAQPLRADNAQTQWKKRSIWLFMPHTWDKGNLDELALSVSEYITAGIEYEFLSMAFGAQDAGTLQRYEALNAAASSITACLSLRTPAPRPELWPAFRR